MLIKLLNILLVVASFTATINCETTPSILGLPEEQRLNDNFVEDGQLLVPQIIEKYGYGVEIHHVTTEDGYILELHRVTNSPKPTNTPKPKYPVIYCIHGTAETSGTYVLTGPHRAFAYYFVDHGFDVWLSNNRGNRYSDKHVRFTTDQWEYWDFSLHEVGYYDTPAAIDHILKVTGEEKLSAVGFSLGTNALLILGSARNEYNHKLHQIHLWGTPLFSIKPQAELVQLNKNVLTKFDRYGDFMNFDAVRYVKPLFDTAHAVCKIPILFNETECRLAIADYMNDKKHNDDLRQHSVFIGHTTSGVSAKTFLHYSQMISTHKFCWFDHGELRNLFIYYGSPYPPEYKLSRITAPVAVHYSLDDYLTPEEEMVQLGHSLPNLLGLYQVPDKNFSHSEFAFGDKAIDLVYSRVMTIVMQNDNDEI